MSNESMAFVCSHIFDDTRPVLLVCRPGGDWQFLCGETHDDEAIPKVVGLNHLLERDPTLEELRDLPDEWEAERISSKHQWIKTSATPDK